MRQPHYFLGNQGFLPFSQPRNSQKCTVIFQPYENAPVETIPCFVCLIAIDGGRAAGCAGEFLCYGDEADNYGEN